MLNTMLALFKGLTPMDGESLKGALEILWKGLLAIFIVIFAIIIVVKVTALIIAKCEEAKKKKAENEKSDDGTSN